MLLAHDLQAVRIDEQALTVHGLTLNDEARIPLNPNCRPAQYLKRVRDAVEPRARLARRLSGIPATLDAHGPAKDAQLEKLLLLGESEAVVAVAGAPGLTDDIARQAPGGRCQPPTSPGACSNAKAVARGQMGKVLAAFLVEHLPFETDPLTTITTVRLVLQPGLIGDDLPTHLDARHTA